MPHTAAATFAAVFVILWVAHSLGDHWVQTSAQSAAKGKPGRAGRLADTRHVLALTVTKFILLALGAGVLDLRLSVAGVLLGLGLDAASHWWADRRTTLERLAVLARKHEFYQLGSDTLHTTTAEDDITGKHLGTGAYALDQSFHHLWLLVAALVIAAA
ncbi:transcriptional regulator [Streptomyces sp. NPDC001407]|uniref:transcriptional regulator n=1 Tax=Streptomyces sp. NPDC001407 TaxID=3364573 RepID=UPI0036767EEB